MFKKKNQKRRFEVFNYEEKKKFVDTLLIVGSILVALRFSTLMIPIFILFIVASLGILIWISILEKMSNEERLQNPIKSRTFLLSLFLSLSFSSIIATMSVQGITVKDAASLIIVIVSMLAIYLSVGYLLYKVLVQCKNVADNCDIDVVD